MQTKICIYSTNGREPYDIIQCCNPSVYSAISKTLSNKAVIACLNTSASSLPFADYKEDSIIIKDYSSSTQREEDLRIIKPFGSGYEIGGLTFDEEGHRLAVVSKDACYVYLYITFGHSADPKENKPIEIKEPF